VENAPCSRVRLKKSKLRCAGKALAAAVMSRAEAVADEVKAFSGLGIEGGRDLSAERRADR
jgi:hypothetical protein